MTEADIAELRHARAQEARVQHGERVYVADAEAAKRLVAVGCLMDGGLFAGMQTVRITDVGRAALAATL